MSECKHCYYRHEHRIDCPSKAQLRRRDEAWKRLVQHLIDDNGGAPPFGVHGLWVDLYDEVTTGEQIDGSMCADDPHTSP